MLISVWTYGEEKVPNANINNSAAPQMKNKTGEPEVSINCPGAQWFGGTDIEKASFCLAAEGKFASLRTLATKAVEQDPSSIRAQFLMGVAHHQGEGNLPKALYHLEEAERLFHERYVIQNVVTLTPEDPMFRVIHRLLLELLYVHGEMDHHERKIHYADEIKTKLGIDYEPYKAWPLMKLKRFDEAKKIAEKAAQDKEEFARSMGLTALCALESELRNREEAYLACRRALEPVLDSSEDGVVELSNAGAAASEMFRFDEGEKYLLEATRRRIEGSGNPWGRLVRLYVRQGRMSEALTAWRAMRAYRLLRPAFLDQQDQTDADLVGAEVLMLAGYTDEAERITDRTIHRPDRQGTSSANQEQNEGGSYVMDRLMKLEKARRLEEEASLSSF